MAVGERVAGWGTRSHPQGRWDRMCLAALVVRTFEAQEKVRSHPPRAVEQDRRYTCSAEGLEETPVLPEEKYVGMASRCTLW